MATIKSFTSLEQSRKLAEILPLESADLSYMSFDNHITLCPYIKMINDGFNKDEVIPCWSLAALLGVLQYPALFQRTDQKWGCTVWVYTKHPYSISLEDSPINACVAMIEKLNELKML